MKSLKIKKSLVSKLSISKLTKKITSNLDRTYKKLSSKRKKIKKIKKIKKSKNSAELNFKKKLREKRANKKRNKSKL